MSENAAPVSPIPDASRFSTAELLAALRVLPYREAAFLLTRLTQGRSLEESAAFYGISPEAFSVHFLRAALLVCGSTAELWIRAMCSQSEVQCNEHHRNL